MCKEFNFDNEIDRYGTHCTQWDYVQDRFGKKGLLPFTISDMDFATPEPILDALKKRIEHPVFGYSRWDHPEFKSSIRNWFIKRFNCQICEDHLVYGPSVIYIVSKLIEMWSSPGDGIVFHTPAYDAFDKVVTGMGRTSVRSPLSYNNGQFDIDWENLEWKLSNKDNKVLLLCSPHNPTGRVWTYEDLQNIAKLCERYNVKVISDEIHMDISFKTHIPYVGFNSTSNWALVTSASKSFNIPALNGAYAIIPSWSTRMFYLNKLKNIDGLSSPPILGILGLIAAYEYGESWLNAMNEYIHNNHIFVSDYIKSNVPKVNYKIPDATFLAWIDLSDLHIDMKSLNHTLIKEFNIAIMPGSVYGYESGKFIRIPIACPKNKLSIGLERLVKAIEYHN